MSELAVYNMRVQGVPCRCLLSMNTNGITGILDVPTQGGMVRLMAQMPKEAIASMMARLKPLMVQDLANDVEQSKVETSGMSIVGSRRSRKARRRRRRAKWKARFKKLASGKILKKLGKIANKVLNSKFVKGAMKLAKFIPGYGQAINAAYGVAKRAAGVASNLGRGNRGARGTVQALRNLARSSSSTRRGGRRGGRGGQAMQRGRGAMSQVQRAARSSLGGSARRMLGGLFGRSSGEEMTGDEAQVCLEAVGAAYANRYGGALRRIASQGGITGAEDHHIVTGAVDIWGPGPDSDDTLVGGLDIVGGEYAETLKKMFHRGYTPDAPLRDLYASGLGVLGAG